MGIRRTDLALSSGFIQFPGEGSEPRAVRPWVDLQPDRQRSRSSVRSVEELMNAVMTASADFSSAGN